MAIHIGRRAFIAAFGGAAGAFPLVARAQQPERMRRIGVIMPLAANEPEDQARVAALWQGLQDVGWTDGRNARIDIRWPAGGNTTGFSFVEYGICGKWPERLNRVAPHVTHVAVLRDSADPTGNGQFDAIQSAVLIDAPQALREPLRNLH
jgi:hypothetical protein